MRIIAGELKGRIIATPSGHVTHPMSEKIRGALFSVLGDISGLTMLDCFTGSGAVAIEAVSRGASRVTAIDIDKNASEVARTNCQNLVLTEKIKIINANVSSWSDNNRDTKFDLVVCDPPYNAIKSELIIKLTNHVTDRGILIVSLPPDIFIDRLPSSFKKVQFKKYGDATLAFYRKNV